MTTYCQIGDTARVTLSDGRTISSPNSPFNISLTSKWTVKGSHVSVGYGYIQQDGTPRYDYWFSFWALENILSVGAFLGGVYTPIPFRATTFGENFAVLYEGKTAGTYIGVNWGGNPPLNLFVISGGNLVSTLKIVDSLDNVLFDEMFDGTYSVECIAGCPPNTLDCGDCCLPCEDVFNAISDIRRSLSRIN